MRPWLVAIVAMALSGCAAAPDPPPGIAESFAGQAVPDAALRRRIIVETEAYWSAIEAGNWDGAYDRFTDDYRERVPYPEWRRLRHDAWAARPRITGIRWTQAAHRHHGPELYAIVNWTARRASSGSEGTLVWRQGRDGAFRLENTEVRALISPRT